MNQTRLFLLAILCTVIGAYGDVVNKIVIESLTSQDIPEDVVRANIVLDDGAVFSQKRLSEDIKRLMKTGQFADVEAQVVHPGDDQVATVTVLVREGQAARAPTFDGADGGQVPDASQEAVTVDAEVGIGHLTPPPGRCRSVGPARG